ncbi:adenosylcobinamide-GDP ribazoletransferase [Lachnoanaerobaculum umeaense]|uniref:Adenosylcobinamide-GDP ribazoletransferase n=1 Tax=Lachnoanaerobaculum umeaense TaxID=617123 RepID=A0A385PZY0_9FIRM|nr:adenosylcobinamide-GDP ribazoletransferase [Lachnoanaerobaculum umeaense]AYA99572.1 adenosylcobinamide-GDP ribazoletransferase [Lachnoanaerobaculum umeaense]PZW96493.1 cobalamin-5'-phosphate synthase [Lachnoanaerobaculum umeaense]
MIDILKSMAITFAMYSKLPVRSFNWEKENMKYCLLFLPMVGLVEGIFLIIFYIFFYKLKVNHILVAAFLTVLPILYTGGIHMDGFLDTMDALGSNQDKQKKLAILKDSNSGAFAITGGLVYILLYFAAMLSLNNITKIYILAISYILIRAYSALSLIVFKNARGSGLAFAFSDNSLIYTNRVVLLIFIVISSVAMIIVNVNYGLLCVIATYLVFLYYRVKSFEEFGGITGDLAGYFLQLAELVVVLVLALAP